MAKRLVSVRVEDDAVTQVDALAARIGATRSEMIERAIRLMLKTSAGTAELQYDIARQKRYG